LLGPVVLFLIVTNSCTWSKFFYLYRSVSTLGSHVAQLQPELSL
jgi:hypothetical protein